MGKFTDSVKKISSRAAGKIGKGIQNGASRMAASLDEKDSENKRTTRKLVLIVFFMTFAFLFFIIIFCGGAYAILNPGSITGYVSGQY